MDKKIVIILLIGLIACLSIPFVSASYVCPAAYNGAHSSSLTLQEVFPGTLYNSAYGESFTANATCYLYNMTFSIAKGGSPGFMRAFLFEATGTPGTDAYPTVQIFASSTPKDANTFPSSASDQTFYFDGTYQITSGQKYAAIVACYNGSWGASYARVYRTASDVVAGMNAVRMNAGSWEAVSTAEVYFIINGDTESELPMATPTPPPATATPTPPSNGGDATVENLTNILLPILIPLLVVLVPAFLGLKFVGQWGFMAGLNVGAVIAYVTLSSTAYSFPLWGILFVGIVDVLLVMRARG